MIKVTRYIKQITIEREIERGEREQQQEVEALRAKLNEQNIAIENKRDAREEDLSNLDTVKLLDAADTWGISKAERERTRIIAILQEATTALDNLQIPIEHPPQQETEEEASWGTDILGE